MRWLLSLQLLLGLPLYSRTGAAQTAMTDSYFRQWTVSLALNELMPKLAAARGPADLLKLMPPDLSSRDRKTVLKRLKRSPLPRFVRLNRGIGFKAGGQLNTIAVEDVFRGRMKINERVDFTWQKHNPLDIQAEVLGRALNKKVSVFNWLVPEAHAVMGVDDIIVMVLVSGIVMTVVGKVVNDVIGDGFWAWGKSWYCQGKSPSTGYATSQFCKDYFKWQAENNKSTTIPDAKDSVDVAKAVEHVSVKKKCRRNASDPDMVNEARSDDNKMMTRTTVKFSPDNKPRQMVFEFVSDGNHIDKKIVVDVDADRTIQTVKDGEGNVIATNDKTAIGTMNPTQVTDNADNLKRVNELIKPAVAFIETCNAEADQSIAAAAGQPGALLADQVKTPSAVLPTMLPTSGEDSVTK